MIKLIPAKCPSCGASIELDDNLKKSECQYCRTKIIVDEAIQKYQVEVVGSVKVNGTFPVDEHIEVMEKNIKLGNYEAAMIEYRKITSKYGETVEEAEKLFVEMELILLKEKFNIDVDEIDISNEEDLKRVANMCWEHYEENSFRMENPSNKESLSTSILSWFSISLIKSKFEIVKKLDDKGKYEDFIKRYGDLVDKVKTIYDYIDNFFDLKKKEAEKLAMEYNEKMSKSILRKMTFNKIIKELGIKLKYVETLKFTYIGDNYIYYYLQPYEPHKKIKYSGLNVRN